MSQTKAELVNGLSLNTASDDAATIDSSGRLLVGKTASKNSDGDAAAKAQIESTGNCMLDIAANGTTSSSYAGLNLIRSDGSSVNDHTAVDNGDRIGRINFIGADGSDRFNSCASIRAFAAADFTANNCPADLSFLTNGGGAAPSERMRISSNGAISVGTDDAARSFTLFNPVSSDTIFRVQNNNNNEDTGLEVLYVADSVTRTMRMGGYIQANSQNFQFANTEGITFYTNTGTGTHERLILAKNGDVNAQGIYDGTTSNGANVNVHSDGHLRRSTSSRRYKNTITDATHGLTELLKLKSVTFKGNEDGDTIFGGLIAEDVHDAGLTEFVQYDKDNQPDALAYGNMVALCVKSIQELSAKVTSLETEVAALKAA